MTLPAIFAIVVGIVMIGQWAYFYTTDQIPELHTEPLRIGAHLAAEFITAALLIISGIGLLTGTTWARSIYLVAIGMVIYSLIASPGYFAQRRVWAIVALFVVVLILAIISAAAVITYVPSVTSVLPGPLGIALVDFNLTCPIPISDYPNVLLAHGSGGRLMHQLIERLIVPTFANPALEARQDGAALEIGGARLAFTTDSYVVHPLFFPGGDIGTLAVNGTVNDLAMCGARPLYLSAGLIIEEGLPMETLWRVVQSMQATAQAAGVQIVTGDTKVVDRGKGDGIFVNTTGVGLIEHPGVIAPSSVRQGDVILLNGDVGRHGMAIMAAREGLEFETTIESDCAPLARDVFTLLDAGIIVHCLRDLTRGGLASALIEIAEAARLSLQIDENAVPVDEQVRGACEILGLDPLYVANEGRFIAFVPAEEAKRALALMGTGARRIGLIDSTVPAGLVTIRSTIGSTRILDMLSGEQLPRIC